MATTRSKLSQLRSALLQPASNVTAPQARYTAFMVMRAIVLTIGAGMLAVVATAFNNVAQGIDSASSNLINAIGLTVIGGALYLLAQRGWHMLALRILIAITLTLAHLAAIPEDPTSSYAWGDLIYLTLAVLPLMLAGMLLPRRELIATAGVTSVGIVLVGSAVTINLVPIVFGLLVLIWTVTIMACQLRLHATALENLRGADLAEKNAIFTLVERYSKDIIMLINPDLTIRYATPNANLLTMKPLSGTTGQSFVDPAWTQFLNAQHIEKGLASGILRLISGQDIQATVEFKREDGRLFWLDSTTSLIQEGDAMSGAVMILRDVTERKQAEDALKHERNLLRTLIDNLPDYVYVLDRDQHIVLSNRMTQVIYGVQGEETVLNRVWESGLTPRAAVALAQENARVLNGEVIIEQESDVEMIDGTVYTLAMTKVPLLNDAGAVIGLVGRTRDITQQKRTQRLALEQAKEQEQLSAALQQEKQLSGLKTIFMNLISHEFRTPLAKIRSAVDMIERYSDRMTTESRAERMAVITREIDQLKAMLDDITTVLQLQSGSTMLTIEDTDASGLVQETIHDLTAVAGDRAIQFDTRGDIRHVRIDRRMFRYITRNLIGNAIKYSPEQAPITVELARQDGDGGDVLTLTVRDQGIGMDDETRNRMFEPFFRGKNSEMVAGTGLGLKIVHDCVILQNGSIDVESEPNQGTRITVTLPLPTDNA